MKTFWIGFDNKEIEYFIDYAAKLKAKIPEEAEILAATDDDGIVKGFAAVVATKDVSDIVFFFVAEEARGKNIGRTMLKEIEKTVRESGVSIIRCVVPNEDGIVNLFFNEGYDFFDTGTEYAVSVGALYYSGTYRKSIYGKEPVKAKSLDQFTPEEKKIFKSLCHENIIEELDFFNPKLSAAVFDGDTVKAFLLCESNMKGIIVDYMHSEAEHPENLIDCFRVLDKALSTHKEETSKLMISFATGNDTEERFLKRLAGDVVLVEEFVREDFAIKRL
ncbi:MAG: GNAT family N-acetyltransferase [Butyrivibrio sp.]|nr:GNAT family N-acetyltransferase [Butyrivibrio sp.]